MTSGTAGLRLEGQVETMGFYSRYVFPRLCDCLMGLPALAGLRKEVLADVGGDDPGDRLRHRA